MECCDIYITGIKVNNTLWQDDVDYILEQIFNTFCEIADFKFFKLSLNMAQVYNVNLRTSYYESMTLSIRQIKYKNKSFLTQYKTNELVSKIKTKLALISELIYAKIEVRTQDIFSCKQFL